MGCGSQHGEGMGGWFPALFSGNKVVWVVFRLSGFQAVRAWGGFID